MELFEQLLTSVSIVSTCITIYIFCRNSTGIYWIRVVVLSIIATIGLSIWHLTPLNALILIGEIIAVSIHSRHPLTQQIHYGRLTMIVGASLVLFLVSQTALPLWQAVTHSSQAGPIIPATLRAANPNPYPPHEGTLVLYDPLSDNSRGYVWMEPSLSNNPNCYFAGNVYHAIGGSNGTAGSGVSCEATKTDFSNFAFEVQMKFVKGQTEVLSGYHFPLAGMTFRDTKDGWYILSISMDGSYSLQVCPGGICTDLTTPWATEKAFHVGLNTSNVIAVVANNNSFDLYVNGKHIAGPIINNNDSASVLTHGAISVDSLCGKPCEVVYSNAKVWSF
jgi:hypothetical protein